MKLLTRNTDYAVQALIYLAKNEGKVVSALELNQHLKLPRPFLRSLLQKLTKAGYIKSFKGKGGGFKLLKPCHGIQIIELIKIFQGKFEVVECLLKGKPCPNRLACRLRKELKDIADYVRSRLTQITISSLLG